MPLTWACQVGCRHSVQLLLHHGALPDVDCISSSESVLYRCARFGDYEIVRSLLEGGATPDRGDPVVRATPIQVAMAWRKQDVALLLLSFGADPHQLYPDGSTLMHAAVEGGMAQLVLRLLQSTTVTQRGLQVYKRLAQRYSQLAVTRVLEDYERHALLSLSRSDSRSNFSTSHLPEELTQSIQSMLMSEHVTEEDGAPSYSSSQY